MEVENKRNESKCSFPKAEEIILEISCLIHFVHTEVYQHIL